MMFSTSQNSDVATSSSVVTYSLKLRSYTLALSQIYNQSSSSTICNLRSSSSSVIDVCKPAFLKQLAIVDVDTASQADQKIHDVE